MVIVGTYLLQKVFNVFMFIFNSTCYIIYGKQSLNATRMSYMNFEKTYGSKWVTLKIYYLIFNQEVSPLKVWSKSFEKSIKVSITGK